MHEVVMNTGTRAGMIALMFSELVMIVNECRWMIMFVVVVIVADFWLGRGEAQKRLQDAEEQNDRLTKQEYNWRTSRAVRRTVNKFIDYLLWLCVGMVFGKALLEPIGVPYIYAAVGATALSMFCEVKSVAGHLLYLHGIELKQKTISGFMQAVLVGYMKRKSPDVGEALEEGFDKTKS